MLVQSRDTGDPLWLLTTLLVDYITELVLDMFHQQTTNSESALKDIKAYFVLTEN